VNRVFKALADPTRRRVLQLLRTGPMSAGELSEQFPVSKPTMSAHFAILPGPISSPRRRPAGRSAID
jgi:DNA-binding transcriptional ArsR family regulator